MNCLIFEGPDCAGKTTLIEQLAKYLRYVRVDHHGAYLGEEKIAWHYLRSLYAARHARNGIVALDRSWLAERIYGEAMRGGVNRVGVAEQRMLERVALGASAFVVLCLPNYETCEAKWQARLEREYAQKRAAYRAVYDGYERLWCSLTDDPGGLSFMRYDYTQAAPEDVLLTYDTWRQNFANEGPGIGNWHAETLLIGDAVNERTGWGGLPFVSLEGGGCSAWLAWELEAAGVRERDLYWVNQAEVTRASFEPWGLERFATVVALGGHAVAWCERHEVEHTACPHPQYWKRFRHRDYYPLLDVLLNKR